MEIPLTPEQSEALAAAGAELDQARAAVGVGYMRHEEARAVLERAKARLDRDTARAAQAEVNHAAMMRGLAQVLELPPGKYTYDRAAGCLRKDAIDE